VVVVLEMAQLVHDDVFNAMDGKLNEIKVQGYSSGWGTAAPTSLHLSDMQTGLRHSMARSNGSTIFKISIKNRFCMVAVPAVH